MTAGVAPMWCMSRRRAEHRPGVVSGHPDLPAVWSAAGWRLRPVASSLVVYAPCGWLAGAVACRVDGRWSVSGVYPPGFTFGAVRDSAFGGVALLCGWWTSRDYRAGAR